MSDKLIVLETYMFPHEAYPLMTKLKDEGIECFLEGENTVNAHPFLSNAIGGVKLIIKECDAEKAIEIHKNFQTD